MLNTQTDILKESIERYKQEMIYLYFRMDINDFEEVFNTNAATMTQAIKKVAPIYYVDKWVEKLSEIGFHAHAKESHIETHNTQHHQYIENIFDDIFDGTFFDLFSGFEMESILSIDSVINNIFGENSNSTVQEIGTEIQDNNILAIEENTYNISEKVDTYLEQFSSTNSKNVNTQNQEMNMG